MAATTHSSISCWRCGSADVQHLQRDARRPGTAATATPTPSQTLRSASGPVALLEEGGDDADDQGGLEPLAQADDERREHARLLPRVRRFALEPRGALTLVSLP